jgi:hypothetical protein
MSVPSNAGVLPVASRAQAQIEKEQFMKRLLILLALAGLTTAVACGDDSGDTKTTPEVKDSGAGTGIDAGPAVPVREAQITNVGAACDPKSTTDCKGPANAATCEDTFGMGQMSVPLPGGYCTAQCNATAECGTNGGCPSADIQAGLSPAIASIAAPLLGFVPSQCLVKCDKAVATSCRTGYQCKTIAELVPAALASFAGAFTGGPAFKVPYCVPPVNFDIPDGGLGGTTTIPRTLDGGVDAGK